MDSVEFLLRLLERDASTYVTAEDFDGPHREAILTWQRAGFIAREPSSNPAPTCPHCADGVPYRISDRSLCRSCGNPIDQRHLLAWPIERDILLLAITRQLKLRVDLRLVEPHLWHLGTATESGRAVECFVSTGLLSDLGRSSLAAYRHVLVLCGPDALQSADVLGRSVPLAAIFQSDGSLAETTCAALLRPSGAVRFELHSGALWIGDRLLGEISPGSKEFHFLECLFEQLDHFVPYRDLKREVLRRSGSTDETDEATFCQVLKRRLKRHGMTEVDRVISTTNKGDGYRLRAFVPEPY